MPADVGRTAVLNRITQAGRGLTLPEIVGRGAGPATVNRAKTVLDNLVRNGELAFHSGSDRYHVPGMQGSGGNGVANPNGTEEPEIWRRETNEDSARAILRDAPEGMTRSQLKVALSERRKCKPVSAECAISQLLRQGVLVHRGQLFFLAYQKPDFGKPVEPRTTELAQPDDNSPADDREALARELEALEKKLKAASIEIENLEFKRSTCIRLAQIVDGSIRRVLLDIEKDLVRAAGKVG